MSTPEPISVHDDAAAFRTSVSNMKMAVFLLRASIQQSKPDQGWPQRAQFYLDILQNELDQLSTPPSP